MKKVLVGILAAIMMCSSCHFNFSNAGGVSFASYSEEGGDYTETRTPGFFDEIHSYGPFNVYYIQSADSKVVIEGGKEFVDKLKTEVKDGDLTLSLEKGSYNRLVLKVTVYAPDVEEIILAGSGDLFDMEGHTSNDDIKYTNAGSGNINVGDIKCKDFEARVAGSGDVKVGSIVAKDAEFKTSGSAKVVVENITAENVEMSFSGSGNGRIDNAEIAGELELSISGSGNIVVNGKAGRVEAKISGSGNIGGNLSFGSLSTHKSGSGNINFK